MGCNDELILPVTFELSVSDLFQDLHSQTSSGGAYDPAQPRPAF